MYTYIHTNTYTHTYIPTYMYIHTYQYIDTYTPIHTHIQTYRGEVYPKLKDISRSLLKLGLF